MMYTVYSRYWGLVQISSPPHSEESLFWFDLDFCTSLFLFPAALYWEVSSFIAVCPAFYRKWPALLCHNSEFSFKYREFSHWTAKETCAYKNAANLSLLLSPPLILPPALPPIPLSFTDDLLHMLRFSILNCSYKLHIAFLKIFLFHNISIKHDLQL